MSSLTNKVAPKIEKVIKRFPTKASIVVPEIDEIYKEPTGNLTVKLTVTGFYHEDDYKSRIGIEDKGVVYTKEKAMFLMVLITDDTKLIEQGDTLVIENQYYEVVDVVNPNKLDIYFDIQLRQVSNPWPDLG